MKDKKKMPYSMMEPQDCFGSPPPESLEGMHQQGRHPQDGPSFHNTMVTPSTQASNSRTMDGSRRSHSSRGRSSSRSRRSSSHCFTRSQSRGRRSSTGDNTPSPQQLQQQQPRKSSSKQPKESPSSASKKPPTPLQQARPHVPLEPQAEPYLLRLPPSLLPHWCCLVVCSAVCLAAVASGTPLTTHTTAAEQTSAYEDMQMVMAIATLSLMATFVASICYILIPASFVGTLYEVTVIGLNIIMWSGALPIIMNPNNSLAVEGTSIVNGNLFCLSWLNFFASCAVLKLVIEQLHVMDQARAGNLAYLTPSREGYPPLIPLTPTRCAHAFLILSNLAVLVAGTRGFMHQDCNEWDRTLCQRLKFTLSVAVMSLMGLLFSWLIAYLCYYTRQVQNSDGSSHQYRRSWVQSPFLRLNLLGLLSFGWLMGTGFTTFGRHAPGHAFGNLFLGNWASFGLSVYLFKKTLIEYLTEQQVRSRRRKAAATPSSHPPNTPTLDVSSSKGPMSSRRRQQHSVNNGSPTSGLTHDVESPAVNVPDTPDRISPRSSAERKSSVNNNKSYHSSVTHGTARTIDLGGDTFLDEDLDAMESNPEFGFKHGNNNNIIKESWTERTASMEDFEDDVASVETTRRGHISGVSSTHSTPNTGNRSRPRTGMSGSFQGRGELEEIKPKSIPFFTEEDCRLSSSLHNSSRKKRDSYSDPEEVF